MPDRPKQLQALLIAIIVLLAIVVVLLIKVSTGNRTHAVAPNALQNLPLQPPADDVSATLPEAGETLNAEAEEEEPQTTDAAPNLDTVEEDLLAAARAWNPALTYDVDGHSRGWTEASVYAGAKKGARERVVTFQWKDGRYQFASEEPGPDKPTPGPAAAKPPARPPAKPATRPAPAAPSLTERDLEGVPDEFRPGQSTALEAALAGREDWVGKVHSHSADWSRASVWIGEPASEYSLQLDVTWNVKGQYYDITGRKPIGGN